jgi:membrane protease YdiL (CAAX protease family)
MLMQDIIGLLVIFVPLMFILWLANLADRQREAGQPDAAQVLAVVAYTLLVLLYLGALAVGLVLQAVGALVGSGSLPATVAGTYRQMGIDPAQIVAALPRVAVGLWLPALLGILLLLPPVRRLFARWIPIDPARTVHAIALSFPALILMNLLVTLGIGLGALASLAQYNASQGVQLVSISGVWAQELLMAAMGIIGVGWLVRRGLLVTFDRLGIHRPTLAQAGAGLGIGLLMVPLVLLIEYLGMRTGVGINADVQKLSNDLIGPLGASIPGVLTLGLAAAIGEETLMRGALQPRFGLFLTALLFALLHSTYGLTLATLSVFLLGLVLGLVRMRANTTTSMIVHAIYNSTLGLIAYLGFLQNF